VNQTDFDRIAGHRPSLWGHFTFWAFLILYCISLVFSLIKAWEFEPIFVHVLLDRPSDLVFPLFGNGPFAISFLFAYIPVGFLLLSIPFRIIPGFTLTYRWYDLRSSKTSDFESYRRVSQRNAIVGTALFILALFFMVQSVGLHLRITASGIYYQRYFSFSETRIDWSELEEVIVYPEITESRKAGKNLSPKMSLILPNDQVEIWQGAGLGSPSSDELIRFIGLVQANSSAKIVVNGYFNSDMQDQLDNHSVEWKRENIQRVFDYLRQIEKR